MEIQHNGVWGTVCDDFWDEDDATVVCHQLGFFGDATALQGSQFGQGERGENRHCLTFGELAYFFLRCFTTELNLDHVRSTAPGVETPCM